VFEIKNQELPATLKIEEALSSGTLVCSTYKCELRHFRPDCNHLTFSKVNTCNLRIQYVCWQHFTSAHNTAKQDAKQKEMDA